MKKILLLIGMMSLMLTSCGKITGNDSESLPQTAKIFLIDRYKNSAWVYQDKGIFIDTSGAVYAFDFERSPHHIIPDEQLLSKFDIVRDNTEPIMTIDSNTITKLYSLGTQIDPESEFEIDPKVGATDAGSHTALSLTHFVLPDKSLLLSWDLQEYVLSCRSLSCLRSYDFPAVSLRLPTHTHR